VNRAAIIAAVALASYALLDIALSSFVAIVWRTRAIAPADLPPSVRARRLLYLRLAPTVSVALITLTIVAPAFVIYEPAAHDERLGPALAVLAIVALFHVGSALFTAAKSAWLTARIERAWLRSASVLDRAIAGDVPSFVIDSPSPMVALVGVFSPKLMAARSIVAACTPAEIASIVGHERGHLQAGDNIKRWIMASLPDALRWTPIHREIIAAWHHAAEDAADDVATGGDAIARAELAALLLKIVRLAPQPMWNAAIVSPFVENDGLERRVRRLLQPDLEAPAPLAIVPVIAVTAIVVASISAVSSPAALAVIFHALEGLVAFGR
jgi:beta-lactamase regulating signal transducer with metallopeptidase domain